MEKTLWETVAENAIFVGEFIGIVALLVFAAYMAEKWANKKNGVSERILSTRKVAVIGMFSAIGAVLMVLEVPVPFAPSFYGLDFSEVPALIGAFAFGPVAGVMTEFCKVFLKILFKPTSTAFVGELANFVVGCSFLLPASVIYLIRKTRKNAMVAGAVGTLCMTVFGSAFNAVYLLPKFAQMFGLPLEVIVEMGTAVNPFINSISTLVLFGVAPLNLLKGVCVSVITLFTYKKLSPVIKPGKERTMKK